MERGLLNARSASVACWAADVLFACFEVGFDDEVVVTGKRVDFGDLGDGEVGEVGSGFYDGCCVAGVFIAVFF